MSSAADEIDGPKAPLLRDRDHERPTPEFAPVLDNPITGLEIVYSLKISGPWAGYWQAVRAATDHRPAAGIAPLLVEQALFSM